ncbi:Maternal effect embryo arrest protein [Arachis hypogaea]|nr:Maternal effect embryo arrest protein [Arachis hypogaea]
MALSADHPFKPVSATTYSHCEAWKKKCSKLQESQNALRQTVKLLQIKINENVKKNGCEPNQTLRRSLKNKSGGDTKNEKESIEDFQACIADKEKEISRLKELLEAEKKKADKEKKNSEKERKKTAEVLKAVEAEKSKTAKKEMQIAKVEAEKAEDYRTRLVRLEKEANEAKTKLAHKCERLKIWMK